MKMHLSHEEGGVARLEALFREKGLPLTVQRRLILKTLLDRRDHPTADEIYMDVKDRLPGVSRTTVYRVLETIVRMGIANKVSHPGAAVRFDPITERHHHLVCRHCDKVVDLEGAPSAEVPLPETRRTGFQITDYSIYFRGVCSDCLKKKEGKR